MHLYSLRALREGGGVSFLIGEPILNLPEKPTPKHGSRSVIDLLFLLCLYETDEVISRCKFESHDVTNAKTTVLHCSKLLSFFHYFGI